MYMLANAYYKLCAMKHSGGLLLTTIWEHIQTITCMTYIYTRCKTFLFTGCQLQITKRWLNFQLLCVCPKAAITAKV